MASLNIAIVGITGAVGQEMLNCLESRDFPVNELRPLASVRSAGKTINFRNEESQSDALLEKKADFLKVFRV